MIHGVVDFFDFRVWPIFNVADIGICIGVAFVVYYLFTVKETMNNRYFNVMKDF